MRHECYFCHIRTIEKLIKKFQPDAKVAEDFIFAVHELLAANRATANPKLATEIHRMAGIYLRNKNLYAESHLTNPRSVVQLSQNIGLEL